MKPIAECVIDAVDWSTYRVAGGSATMLGAALRDLLVSSDVGEASVAWNEIEEHVFSQGTIYSAAEPTVSVVLAALTEDQPSWRSGRMLDLLFFIVRGTSVTDSTLQSRCRDRAREGLWLLARWALAHEGWARDNALEVIEVVAPDRIELIRSALAAR
ncbi:hypothetical protein [Cellulomonas uda]|uniref:hypothetical protein n=1 Tax=Cellulomonas uda TaxID=1714 RepID=UPI001143C492|nr:hypothetical protein [Cellulomonas uda]NII65691.1 hypothetical protein [Cellulomonas uda]